MRIALPLMRSPPYPTSIFGLDQRFAWPRLRNSLASQARLLVGLWPPSVRLPLRGTVPALRCRALRCRLCARLIPQLRVACRYAAPPTGRTLPSVATGLALTGGAPDPAGLCADPSPLGRVTFVPMHVSRCIQVATCHTPLDRTGANAFCPYLQRVRAEPGGSGPSPGGEGVLGGLLRGEQRAPPVSASPVGCAA